VASGAWPGTFKNKPGYNYRGEKQDMLKQLKNTVHNSYLVFKWKHSGRVILPPAPYKRAVIKHYARKFRLESLVETGTYLGDTAWWLKDEFKQIYSIELDEALYQKAGRRLSGLNQVVLLKGDSSSVLPGLLSGLKAPCLFWLDAHYSGLGTARGEIDTPVLTEVKAIFGNGGLDHVLLIDDARLFDGTNGYPSLTALENKLREFRPGWTFEVKDDIIRIHP